MLSKAKIKKIKSLEYKKYRDEYSLFVAEGEKLVGEIINSDIEIYSLYTLSDIDLPKSQIVADVISEAEMKQISFLKTPSKAFVVAKIPKCEIDFDVINNSLSIVLDDIQDPGNLGTIIRLADWYGIKNIICSHETVDCFSQKVVQATMGAISRVKIHYIDFVDFFARINKNLNVYGTFMDGENIYTSNLSKNGLIIMGNEGKGISNETTKFVNKKISIPCFSNNEIKPESLNVAIATAVVCSEFKRR